MHWYAHYINKIWSHIVFNLCGTPCVIEEHFKQDKNQTYVFCANHTSYADIALMYRAIHIDFCFIGKHSLGKVPLFGYMYRTLHILVDRKSRDSKIELMNESKRRIDNGQSIMIFPEGTIPKHTPKMAEFKDGAFRLAIEKQIPIVPVTIPNNWIILADDGRWLCHWGVFKAIVHEPIPTIGLQNSDLQALKEKTYNVIHNEILKYHPIPS